MASRITQAGEQFFMAVSSGEKKLSGGLLADKIIFAFVDGLNPEATPGYTEGQPSTIIHAANVTRAGALSENAVTFNALLDSDVGNFKFNWLGLFNSQHNVLMAVAYEPEQDKIKTTQQAVGNVLSKGFAINVKGIAPISGVKTSAQSWQFDFSERQKSAEKAARDAMHTAYGNGTYQDTSAKLVYADSKFKVSAGTAVIGGIKFSISETVVDLGGTYPKRVYAEVWQQATGTSIENKIEFKVSASELESVTDSQGNYRHREWLALINSTADIQDKRSLVVDALPISQLAKQAVETANQANSTATTAHEKASAADTKSDQAVTTADSAQSAATQAVSTANSAQSAATQAASDANTAQTAATQATSAANTAQAAASSAASDANTAQTAASQAASDASTAQSAASSAATDAGNAVNAANDANNTAGNALQVANEAKSATDESLKKSENLAGLGNKAEARNNLGIYCARIAANGTVLETELPGLTAPDVPGFPIGQFRITHNLGERVKYMAATVKTPSYSYDIVANCINNEPNFFDVVTANTSGTEEDFEIYVTFTAA